jgi:fatty acid desaturase
MRDYSLLGPENAAAVAKGLAGGKWYRSAIPRDTMQVLMQRTDGPAIRDTIFWLSLLIGFGAGAIAFWGSWWCVPFLFCYGVLYGSSTDSRWHECGHHSAFKTRWMNNAVYQLACFMIMREPEIWRWSHTRHHADTIIVGRDPEIQQPRPPNLFKVFLNFFGVIGTPPIIRKLLIHASGRMLADEKTYVPEALWPKVARTAWIWLVIHAASIGAAIALQSWLPVLLVGVLPTMYGTWLQVAFGMTQHQGMAEDVLDHRLSTRTVMMNPVFRFLYWNMNYHVEHHMYPMVPYHALPKLHEAMRHDTPAPCKSTLHAFAEIIPALIRQQRDPGYSIRHPLPSGASPYRPEPIQTPVTVPAE